MRSPEGRCTNGHLSERGTFDPQSQRNDTPSQAFAETPRATYPPLIGTVMAMAALYFGRDIFIPLAIAILLTFALAPGVSWLRKLRIPRPVAVVSVVLAAFASIFLFGAVLATQLGSLITFYETVAIPALALGELDRARGVMTDDRHKRVAESAITLVDNLEELAEEEATEDDEDKSEASQESASEGETAAVELPNGAGKTVLCAAGGGELDNAAVVMLAQVLTVQGTTASMIEHPRI